MAFPLQGLFLQNVGKAVKDTIEPPGDGFHHREKGLHSWDCNNPCNGHEYAFKSVFEQNKIIK
jgi:hypothetical protein